MHRRVFHRGISFLFLALRVPRVRLADKQHDCVAKLPEPHTVADYATLAALYEQQAHMVRQRQQRYEAQRIAAAQRRSGPVKRTGAAA